MTSFGADKNLTDRNVFTTFKIQGQCLHLIGSLLPIHDEQAKYLQVYFLNGEEEVQQRVRLNEGAHADIISDLQAMLHDTHPYVSDLKYAVEVMERMPGHNVVIRADQRPLGKHSWYSI
jgi:hypothetical protein